MVKNAAPASRPSRPTRRSRRPRPLGRLDQAAGLEALDPGVGGGQVHHEEGSRQHDPTLEPAAGRDLSVGHRLQPHDDQDRGTRRPESNGRAGRRDTSVRSLFLRQPPALVPERPQQNRYARYGGEEDVLLEEGVDPPEVEADGRHHIGGMALGTDSEFKIRA